MLFRSAPVTGKYFIGTIMLFGGLAAANTSASIYIFKNAGQVNTSGLNIGAIRDNTNTASFSLCSVLDLAASDTVVIKVDAGGSTKVVDLLVGPPRTSFFGYLIC